MINKSYSLILPAIILAALMTMNGCAKRVSTSQLDEGGTKYSDPFADTGKTDQFFGDDLIAIAEPSIPSADVYESDMTDSVSAPSSKFMNIKDIYFDFDKYTILDIYRPVLQNNAQIIKKNKADKVVIEGYTDDRGTNEYNLALGERRAQSTKRYLVALGINPTKIFTISYGEEKQFCSEGTEACWQQNRRAHFIVE